MKAIRLAIPDVVLFEPRVFGDERGFFFESFNQRLFEEAIGRPVTFVQDNHSRSVKNVLRGLHYQIKQPQGKLVRVVVGEVFDVAVDLRNGSPYFGKWVGAHLSIDNKRQLWIPEGFAHGFIVTSDYAEFLYKTTDYWNPEFERSIVWNDPQLAINWPLSDQPILSAKDMAAKSFADADIFSRNVQLDKMMLSFSRTLSVLAGVVTTFLHNRHLIRQMAWREILAKYKGSVLGALWTVITPVLMLTVYTLVFSVIFKSRWVGGTGSKTEFATLMFCGLIVFNFFSEVINRAPRLILDNPNFVKKVVFPLDSLIWVAMLVALFNAAVSLFVLLCFLVLINGALPWTAILFPILVIPLVLLMAGLAWIFASLGVFLRDVAQAMGIFTSILMFLSPVFYSANALPAGLRVLAQFNPLVFYIENTRNLLIWGQLDGLRLYPFHLASGVLIATLGLAWFRHTRHAFADVM